MTDDRYTEAQARLNIESALKSRRIGLVERLGRCNDLFGKMLLMGHLKAVDRELAELRDRDGTR